MEKKVEGIYDGFKELGTGKMFVLGLQHGECLQDCVNLDCQIK